MYLGKFSTPARRSGLEREEALCLPVMKGQSHQIAASQSLRWLEPDDNPVNLQDTPYPCHHDPNPTVLYPCLVLASLLDQGGPKPHVD